MIGPQVDKVQTQLVVGANSNPYHTIADFNSYWKCDDAAGANFADAGANGNILTQVNAPGSTTGIIGNARTFVAASSQTGSRASNTSLQRDKNWTLAFWAYHTAVPGWQIYASKDNSVAFREFLVALNPSGKVELQCGPIGTTVCSTASSPAATTWFHVTATWNNTSKVGKIFINGSQDASGTSVGAAIAATAAAWTLGAYGSPASLFLNGRLDDVVLWDRVLTDAEILLNASRTTPLV